MTIDGGKPMRYEPEDFDANAYDAARKVLLFDGVAMAKIIKIEFVDTYPEEKYNDLCISEIGLFRSGCRVGLKKWKRVCWSLPGHDGIEMNEREAE